jgi:hypothetical protein
MRQLPGMMRRQLLQYFHDCVDADHALHQDEKTFLKAGRGMNPGTAIPIHQQRDGVSVKFRPWAYTTTAP